MRDGDQFGGAPGAAGEEMNLGMVGRALVAQQALDHRADADHGGGSLRRRQSADAALQVRSARPGRGPREHLPAARGRKDHDGPRLGRRRDGDQPGPARAVARSRPRGDQGPQSRRSAGIQRRAEGVLAAFGAAHHRHPASDPMSMSLDERVLAAYYDRLDRVRDRQVAGDRRSSSSRPIPNSPPRSPT